MSSSLTKEEKFLIEVLRIAEERKTEDEELIDIAIDRNDVGFRTKINPNGVRAIVATMVRGNLVRKRGENEIVLTKTGIEVARSLQE